VDLRTPSRIDTAMLRKSPFSPIENKVSGPKTTGRGVSI